MYMTLLISMFTDCDRAFVYLINLYDYGVIRV